MTGAACSPFWLPARPYRAKWLLTDTDPTPDRCYWHPCDKLGRKMRWRWSVRVGTVCRGNIGWRRAIKRGSELRWSPQPNVYPYADPAARAFFAMRVAAYPNRCRDNHGPGPRENSLLGPSNVDV